MRIRVTKLKEADNPISPNNIPEGNVYFGSTEDYPTVGERFTIIDYNRYFSTSAVQEIIDDSTFRTCNSIYKWEILDKIENNKIPINLDKNDF